MIDAVLTVHRNPLTCGTAKFNYQLAERLGVPCAHISDRSYFMHPLVSLNFREQIPPCFWVPDRTYSLLAHYLPAGGSEPWEVHAERVFHAEELGCPSTLRGNPTRGAYRVLTFGMAHKLALPHFERLKEQLDREHPDYTIELSTAVHEGSPWDYALLHSAVNMRGIFGDKLRVLGFLSDDALAKELQDCDAVAAFFDPALRANNTSAWAAIEAGKKLYTNTDELSPDLTKPPTWDALLQKLGASVHA